MHILRPQATENADVASGLVQIIQPLDGASGASELARRLESWRTEGSLRPRRRLLEARSFGLTASAAIPAGMRSLVIVANLADSEIISSVSNDVAVSQLFASAQPVHASGLDGPTKCTIDIRIWASLSL